MGRAYSDIAFTATVREIQTRMGSRAQYAPLDAMEDGRAGLGRREAAFVAAADHFYQATVSETGWPYVQHRGGAPGFLKVLDAKTLGYADFSGNVQYLSVGNLKTDDRISLILIDYANQMRLKILGRARTVEAADDPALIEGLRVPGYHGRIERAFIISVEGYDWNCPQHITPRFTEQEMEQITAPLHAQVRRLKDELLQSAARRLPPELGGGELALTIAGMRQLTPRVRAYELRSADGTPLPPVTVGAHLDVPVLLADGSAATRRYSIASDSRRRDVYEIAVLREADGAGGSLAVHEQFHLGLVLRCSAPRNDFALDDADGPALLIAGGIGITAIKAMAHELAARGRDFALHYAVRSRAEAPYLDQLQTEWGARLHVYAADEGRRLDVDAVLAGAAANASNASTAPHPAVYVCGPAKLIAAVTDGAQRAGIAADRIRLERFAAAPQGQRQPVTVTLKRSRKVVEVPADRSILDAVQAAGVAAPASCRTGHCGSCAVRVLDGTPDHRDEALSEHQRTEEKLMCLCISRAQGATLTLDL